jgi:hypothetical protein
VKVEENPIKEGNTRIEAVEAADGSYNTADQMMPLHNNDHLVPETLLSLAKDTRYIQQCQALLKELIEPIIFLQRGGDRGHSFVDQLEKDSWVLSSLLYIVLLVVPNGGRSMGMDSLGLKFSQPSSSLRRRKAIVGAMLLSIYGSYAFQRWLQRRSSTTTPGGMDGAAASNHRNATNQEALRGSDQRRMHEALREQMLQRSRESPAQQNTQGQSTPPAAVSGSISNSTNERRFSSMRDRFWSCLLSSTQVRLGILMPRSLYIQVYENKSENGIHSSFHAADRALFVPRRLDI